MIDTETDTQTFPTMTNVPDTESGVKPEKNFDKVLDILAEYE